MARVYSKEEYLTKLKYIRDSINALMAEFRDINKYAKLQKLSRTEEYTTLIVAMDAKISGLDYNRDDIVSQLSDIPFTLWDREVSPILDDDIGPSKFIVSVTSAFSITASDCDLTGVFANGDTIEVTHAENPLHNGLWVIDTFAGGFVFNLTGFPYEADAFAITSITRSSTTATVTTTDTIANLGLATGDYVKHSGANESAYNVAAQITVTGASTYTYTVSGSPSTPATGTITGRLLADSNSEDTSMIIRLYER